jgi:transposase
LTTVRTPTDAKSQALRAAGALNPHFAAVTDAAFVGHPFFDARDLVQVKYEMVRRVEAEGQSVTQTASTFGFSRPAFYAAQSALARGGLPALVRQRPGPRRRHKLRPEIVTALQQARIDEPTVLSSQLAERIHTQFGVRVHRRTIERVLGPRPKRATAPHR